MRKFRGRKRRRRHAVVNIIDNHTTNITNVTNVVTMSDGFSRKPDRLRKNCSSKERHERPPKLLRYCASGGLLDSHLVSGMNHEQNIVEGANVVRYCAKGLSRSAGNMADRAVGVVGSAFGIVDVLVRLGFGLVEYMSGRDKNPSHKG